METHPSWSMFICGQLVVILEGRHFLHLQDILQWTRTTSTLAYDSTWRWTYSFALTVCLGIGGRVLQGSLSPVVIEHWCVIGALDP